MKNIVYVFLLAVLISACGKTKASLENISPDGNVKINISGERFSSLESWKVTMKVKAGKLKEDQLAFEIYASDINNETVIIKWSDNSHCTIIFKQSDDSERNFSIQVTAEQLYLNGM